MKGNMPEQKGKEPVVAILTDDLPQASTVMAQ